MFGSANFEHRVHSRFTYVQIDSIAYVFDVDHARTVLGEDGEQASQTSGTIAHPNEDDQSSTGLRFVTANETGYDAQVDVSS